MSHFCTESRKSRRWPLRFFYDILDQADNNFMILLSLLESKKKKTIRRKFLNELGLQFAQSHMKRRLNKYLPGELGKDIEDILDENLEQ